jgi:hypothetical protein
MRNACRDLHSASCRSLSQDLVNRRHLPPPKCYLIFKKKLGNFCIVCRTRLASKRVDIYRENCSEMIGTRLKYKLRDNDSCTVTLQHTTHTPH